MPAPNELITVTMTATEWNNVIAVLVKAPFELVAVVIDKIHTQGNAQQTAAATNGNGLDRGDTAHVPD